MEALLRSRRFWKGGQLLCLIGFISFLALALTGSLNAPLGLLGSIVMVLGFIFTFKRTPPPPPDRASMAAPKPAPITVPSLAFNVPTPLTLEQTIALRISAHTYKSELPEYQDSFFSIMDKPEGPYRFMVTRRKLGAVPPLNGEPAPLPALTGPQSELEGLKVRTFGLELLSAIEDIQKEIPAAFMPLNERKEVVRYFLENGALEKKAGFLDFQALLTILEKNAPQELIVQLQRLFALVQLQAKLPVSKKSHKGRWAKIAHMIRAGLLTEHLEKTASTAQSIRLTPLPPIPEQQAMVNLYPTIDAINLFPNEDRDVVRWLMTRIRLITFRELCCSIKRSCAQLRDTILTWDQYYLFTIEGKSQEWMANIAYRYLPKEKLPAGILPSGHWDNLFYHYLTTCKADHFIMFDDGAYSGRQLEDYLTKLHTDLLFPNKTQPFPTEKHIYIIFGFYPKNKNWSEVLSQYSFEQYNIHIHIRTSLLCQNADELIDQENLTSSMRKRIQDCLGQKTLLITEWKKPDFMSTPMCLTDGVTLLYGSLYRNRHTAGELKVGGCISAKELHGGIGPITEVTPPYKRPRL